MFFYVEFMDVNKEKIRYSLLFFYIFIGCNILGLTADLITYFQHKNWFFLGLNVFSIAVAIVAVLMVLFSRANLRTSNIFFVYTIATNLIVSNLLNIFHQTPDWQPALFRDAFVYTIAIITTGFINRRQHLFVLNFLYAAFIFSGLFLSEKNYFTSNALILLMLVLGFSLAVALYLKVFENVQKKQYQQQQIVFRKREEVIQKDNLLQKARQDHLNELLLQKNEELLRHALVIAQFRERETQIIKSLKNIEAAKPKDIVWQIKQLEKDLDLNKKTLGWYDFHKNFDLANHDFFKKIKTKFPFLSAAELKLAALIKLGLSSKEIAALVFSTKESIDVARSRLRKKLNLSRATNLYDYLNSL